VYEYVKSVGYPLLICDFIAMVVRWPISFNGMMIYPLGGIHRLPQLPQSYHADGDDFSTHQHGDALGMVYAIGFTPRKPHWMMIYDLFTTGSVPTVR
jgi:hypothetical protein